MLGIGYIAYFPIGYIVYWNVLQLFNFVNLGDLENEQGGINKFAKIKEKVNQGRQFSKSSLYHTTGTNNLQKRVIYT